MEMLNDDFISSIKLIHASEGRVVVSGIGKSAIIANKIVATLNSTGTPAVFLHAADAIHGDLGMIQRNDTVILISNSGNTPEIKVLAPLIKSGGNVLIAMVGVMDSFLATQADYVLSTKVKKEACPNNLAPTSSTTAQLAMGDALAVCLLEMKGFTASDFARYHPGGALGKRLYLKVEDLLSNIEQPIVSSDAPLNEVILEISSKRLGATAVVDSGKLVGIITDGDLRRMMQKKFDFDTLKAGDIMTKNPKTVIREMMAVEALTLMKSNNITQLVVSDGTNFIGFVHLHDLLKEGII
ncbi:MAG: KpsF/GutQ family sugar-phosphate isomerase [Bacteroidetes bacterium]|nr:KpsF/GutQ family sugar-phosphate isomerase [Bacteroidota bacterium]